MRKCVFLFTYLVLSPGSDLWILVGAEEVHITGSSGDWVRLSTKEI